MRRIFLNLDQVTSNELGSKTLTQLRDIAKEIGIKSVSKYKKNDWVYFFTDNISYDYMISLKIIFHSSFKEFQIAFKHRSIFERLRFRIIDNNRLVF